MKKINAIASDRQTIHAQEAMDRMNTSEETKRRYRVLNPNESYTFSKFFELPFAPEDILADLGCTLERKRLKLPQHVGHIPQLEFLRNYLERNLEFVAPISEISRREVLIAPTLLEVCAYTHTRLNIEYTLKVSEWLKGTLDYYIPGSHGLLVIEAKQADLGHGFTQLATELIALDQWVDSSLPILRGAVTTGDLWKFGELHRTTRQVFEDRTLYKAPDELDPLLRILIGIIQSDE